MPVTTPTNPDPDEPHPEKSKPPSDPAADKPKIVPLGEALKAGVDVSSFTVKTRLDE